MKLKELQEFVNGTLDRHPDMGDNEVVIRISKPSIGPVATTSVISVSNGFDWENRMTIIHSLSPVVVKTDQESLWDMCGDFLHILFMEAYERKRKPWYFERLERIYSKAGKLAIMRSLVEKERK